MKASVKLRDGESPIIRAKLPISLLGMPIISGVSLGSSRELAFHLGSLFQGGPSFRFTFRPNSPENPLDITIKAGLGLWGTPRNAPVTVSTQLKLTTRGTPSVSVHFKPRIGSFSLTKHSSVYHDSPDVKKWKKIDKETHEPIGMPETPVKSCSEMELDVFKCGVDNGVSSPSACSEGSSVVMVGDEGGGEDHATVDLKNSGKYDEAEVISAETTSANFASGNSSPRGVGDWSLIAHTSLPLGRHAVASVRWRVKVASDLLAGFQSQSNLFSLKKLPFLAVDKLSVECCESTKQEPARFEERVKELENPELGKVTSMCSAMKHQLRLLYFENRVLKKTMEDMKAELSSGGRRSGSGRDNNSTYMVMNDEELQKQIVAQLRPDSGKRDEQAGNRTLLDQKALVIKGIES